MLDLVTASIDRHALLPAQGTIIVAVSGGADSLCLLHILQRLCRPNKRYPHVQLHPAHLNHQLRGEASEQDALAVEHIVHSWGLPITVGREDVPALARREGRSLEDAARVARYRFLRELAQGQPIAVAHHQDDQVETLLLHWLRGGGLASMVGLQPRQQDIIRPLLNVTHADTLKYCAEQQIIPVEDASNQDVRFVRNRIRHELLPQLAQINPGIRETLLRNAEVMQTDLAWIEQQVDACWKTIITRESADHIQMTLPALRALPLSLQRHLLRRVTARLSGGQSPLELRHYGLLEQLGERETGETLRLDLPGQLLAWRRGMVLEFRAGATTRYVAEKASGEVSQEAVLLVPGSVKVPGTAWVAEAEMLSEEECQKVLPYLHREDWAGLRRLLDTTPYVIYADAARVAEGDEQTLMVRTRRAGDRMQPLGMAHEKKVQDILVNKHISQEEREQTPLFFSARHCVWLAGVQLDHRVRLTKETRHIVRLAIRRADVS